MYDLLLKLLTLHSVSDVRQMEIHTAKPLVPQPSPPGVETAIQNFKRYKFPSTDQILAELIPA
jgi:hypothetical protein